MPLIAELCTDKVDDVARFSVDEPLRKLSRFTFDWASVTCGENAPCQKYHRTWSMIRYLDTGGLLPAAAQQFETTIEKKLKASARNLLISGAADTGLLAIANNAIQKAGITPHVTLIDQCKTTVEQNRLYAKHLKLDSTILRTDARRLADASYDIIVAHNFLYFFDRAGIHELMQAWSRVLDHAGQILMCQNIHDDAELASPQSRPADIEDRLHSIKKSAVQNDFSEQDIGHILAACTEFWQSKLPTHPVTSEIFFSALEQAGLKLASCIRIQDSKSASPASARRSNTSSRAKYFIILEK
jgi:hypothetical protein